MFFFGVDAWCWHVGAVSKCNFGLHPGSRFLSFRFEPCLDGAITSLKRIFCNPKMPMKIERLRFFFCLPHPNYEFLDSLPRHFWLLFVLGSARGWPQHVGKLRSAVFSDSSGLYGWKSVPCTTLSKLLREALASRIHRRQCISQSWIFR